MNMVSDIVTEILGVTPQRAGEGAGSLKIRYRSGRRAGEMYILQDAAVALVLELEAYWKKAAGLKDFLAPASPAARALS